MYQASEENDSVDCYGLDNACSSCLNSGCYLQGTYCQFSCDPNEGDVVCFGAADGIDDYEYYGESCPEFDWTPRTPKAPTLVNIGTNEIAIAWEPPRGPHTPSGYRVESNGGRFRAPFEELAVVTGLSYIYQDVT